jgi:hypothetical protein
MSTTTSVDQDTRFDEGTVIRTMASGSLVSWSAILAGAVLAIAISVLLTTFGNAIGLSMTGPFAEDGVSMQTIGYTALLWFALVHIYAVGMGAYMSGRMRPRVEVTDRGEIQFRDGVNGLLVWAIAVIATVMMFAQVLGTAVSGTASMLASSGATATSMMPYVRFDQQFNGLLDNVTIAGNAEASDATDAGAADANRTSAAGQSTTNQTATGTNAANLSRADRQAIVRALQVRLMDGSVTETEIDELTRIIAQRTNIDAAALRERLQGAATATVEAVKETTEAARQYTALAGFWTTFILLLSGLAAWWCGAVGGVHRDAV